MGRSYNGDISGNLGPASADIADRFGYEGQQPNYLEYFYNKENFDVKELKSIIEELNKGLKFISQFINGENYIIVTGDEKVEYSKSYLGGLELGTDDNLFKNPLSVDSVEQRIRDVFDVFYCFEGNDKRKYESSYYGMKLEPITNEDTDKVLAYIEGKKLIEKLETAIIGAKIYFQIQKNDECNFCVYY